MALFIILIEIIIAGSEKLLEYRLSQNFGDSFYDYSGNFRNGINGRVVGKDDQDTIPSDRGAYFSGFKSIILIPNNDLKEEKIKFDAPYSIVMWTKILDRKAGSDIILINRLGSGGDDLKLSMDSTMDISFEFNQKESNEESTNTEVSEDESKSSADDSSIISSSISSSSPRRRLSKLNMGSNIKSNSNRNLSKIEESKWTLLRIKINSNSIETFLNEYSIDIQSISSYSEMNQYYSMHIGGSPHESNSIRGYVWSLAVDSNFIKEDYMPTTQLSCTAAYFQAGEYKCFPTQININKNSEGDDCPESCSSCKSNICLLCKCQVSSCELKESRSLCICSKDSLANETSCECPKDDLFSGYSCEKCSLKNCLDCQDLKTCLRCKTSYVVINGQCECDLGFYENSGSCRRCADNCDVCQNSKTCIDCKVGFYRDSNSECKPCGQHCIDCNESQCLNCSESFEKTDSLDCECIEGYQEYEKCIRKRFKASIKINLENIVTIQFNSTLDEKLKDEDFIIKCSEVQEPKVKFKAKSSETYEFHVTSDYDIEAGTEFVVTIKNDRLISTDNSLYYKTDLIVNLYDINARSEFSKMMKSNARVVIGASMAAAASLSVFLPSSFFWIILNTIQILAYLPLNSTPYTKTLISFFNSINYLNFFPRVNELLGINIENYDPYLEARIYEIETSVFLINVDIVMIQFLLNIFFIFSLLFWKRFCGSIWNSRISKCISNYRYGYFLKLLTGAYLDFMIYSLIQLRTIPITGFGIFSTIVAIVVIVILIASPAIIIISSYFSKDKIILKNEDFYLKWGALFEEFKNDKGFLSTQFYSIFMVRRMLFGLSQVFLNSFAEAQNALNTLGTLLTLVYLFRYLNYREKEVLICEISGEIAIMVTMVLSLIYLFKLSEDTKEMIETIIMAAVFACILTQIAVCIYVFIIKLKAKFNSKKKALSIIPNYGIKSDGGLGNDISAVYPYSCNISTREKQNY